MFAKRWNSLLRLGRIFIRTCPCRHKDASLFQKRRVVPGIKTWRFLVRNAPLFAMSDVDMILLQLPVSNLFLVTAWQSNSIRFQAFSRPRLQKPPSKQKSTATRAMARKNHYTANKTTRSDYYQELENNEHRIFYEHESHELHEFNLIRGFMELPKVELYNILKFRESWFGWKPILWESGGIALGLREKEFFPAPAWRAVRIERQGTAFQAERWVECLLSEGDAPGFS